MFKDFHNFIITAFHNNIKNKLLRNCTVSQITKPKIVIVHLLEFHWCTIRPIALPSTLHQDISKHGNTKIQQ